MKKVRVCRGVKAQEIPSIPNRELFEKRFYTYYGWYAQTWTWGALSLDKAYSVVKDVCATQQPSPGELEEVKGILITLGLLV